MISALPKKKVEDDPGHKPYDNFSSLVIGKKAFRPDMTDKTEAYKKKWRHASKVNSSSDDADEVVLSETKDDIIPDMNLTLSLDIERGTIRNARGVRPSVT